MPLSNWLDWYFEAKCHHNQWKADKNEKKIYLKHLLDEEKTEASIEFKPNIIHIQLIWIASEWEMEKNKSRRKWVQKYSVPIRTAIVHGPMQLYLQMCDQMA